MSKKCARCRARSRPTHARPGWRPRRFAHDRALQPGVAAASAQPGSRTVFLMSASKAGDGILKSRTGLPGRHASPLGPRVTKPANDGEMSLACCGSYAHTTNRVSLEALDRRSECSHASLSRFWRLDAVGDSDFRQPTHPDVILVCEHSIFRSGAQVFRGTIVCGRACTARRRRIPARQDANGIKT